MSWTTFGNIANLFGAVWNGISVGMTAGDIVDSLLNPNSVLEARIDDLSLRIDSVRTAVDDSREEGNLLALAQAMALVRKAHDLMRDGDSQTLESEAQIRDAAFSGLGTAVATARTILGNSPTVDEIDVVGGSLLIAIAVQLKAAIEFSENDLAFGGGRVHGGYRRASITETIRSAIDLLEQSKSDLVASARVNVSQTQETIWATDASMALTEWWDVDEKPVGYGLLSFFSRLDFSGTGHSPLPELNVTEFTLKADNDVEVTLLTGVLDDLFNDADFDRTTTASDGSHIITAVVKNGSYAKVPPGYSGSAATQIAVGGSTAATVSGIIKEIVTDKIFEAAGLGIDGTALDPVLDGFRSFVDGRFVEGNAGDNVLYGTIGSDGDDFLVGHDGNDVLHGHGGSDYLDGGTGNDTLQGGAGNDVHFGGAGDDVIVDTAGTDTARFTGSKAGYTFAGTNAASLVVSGPDGRDVLTGIETLAFDDAEIATGSITIAFQGGDTADALYGWVGNDTLHAGGGNDQVFGHGGIDGLRGEAGNDRLDGGGGNDQMIGGDGDDTLLGGEGSDTAYFGGSRASYSFAGATGGTSLIVAGPDGRDVLTGIETLSFADGRAAASSIGIFVNGSGASEVLHGWVATDYLHAGGGDDQLFGYGGIDGLRGEAGNDRLDGGAGNDQMDGGEGNDTLIGGEGNDLHIGSAGDDVITDSAGTDRARFSGHQAAYTFASANAGASLIVTGPDGRDVLTGIETLEFINGNVAASSVATTTSGTGAADVLHGSIGFDTVVAGAGDDRVFGHGARDALWGEAGDDWLDGGAGNDLLVGGDGADTFYFASFAPADADSIADFRSGIDRIALESDRFATLGSRVEADEFAFSVAADAYERLILKNGGLYYDADGARDRAAPQLIAMLGPDSTAITANDFLIV